MSICRLFRDERGFTTTSMVLSLLITLALVFTAAQVYRVNSVSAEVQDVADAAALAAENQVAEFMILVRFCDAVVLSMSLAGLTVCGVGIVVLCIPPIAEASEKIIEAGEKILKARDKFTEKAVNALNKLQKALPYFSAACAAAVAAANNGDSSGSNYIGAALLVPAQGEEIKYEKHEASDKFVDDVDENADDVRQDAQEAEDAAREAMDAKQRGYMRDCGDQDRSMYERASSLIGLSGVENVRYSSVDTWSFKVALDRAKAFYERRRNQQIPTEDTAQGLAKLHLMKRFCSYAYDEISTLGYVFESDRSFSACFPSLPSNTSEMERTSLFYEAVYPATRQQKAEQKEPGDIPEVAQEVDKDGIEQEDQKLIVHAWDGCPGITSEVVGWESLSSMESVDLAVCPECQFTVESMGNIASANTSINTGFEYHYKAVAQAAEDYKKAREQSDEQKNEVEEEASSLFDEMLAALKEAVGQRIDVKPPGRFGSVAFVVNVGSNAVDGGFASRFVTASGSLGPRAAISAATLVDEGTDDGRTVINSLLDGLREDGGVAVGALGIVLDIWSAMLQAYTNGVDAITSGIESALNALPLSTASGLGTWAADKLRDEIEALGLQPAKLEALKPVVVNSAHVAAKQDGSLGSGLISLKQQILAHPLYSTDLFTALLTDAEKSAIESIDGMGDSIEIASVELVEGVGPTIPITIPIPDAAKSYSVGMVKDLFDRLREMHADTVEVRAWE